jgi:hypothetical protein
MKIGKPFIMNSFKTNNMIKWFKSRWTMEQLDKRFYDSVSGDVIHYWVDCYGVEWMASYRWGFRVETK